MTRPAGWTTAAGDGTAGPGGDGGTATAAQLSAPADVVVDAVGNVYIADAANHRVRKVAPDGTITTYAGGGTPGADGVPATAAAPQRPAALALDAKGNLFIAEADGNTVRKVDATTGLITTVAGTGAPGSTGDGAAATAALLYAPKGLAVIGDEIYIADTMNHRVQRLDLATGTMTTVAGKGTAGFVGDGGPAAEATLNRPYAVAFDADGNLAILDGLNHRVRLVAMCAKTISTLAGEGGSVTIPSGEKPISAANGLSFTNGSFFLADTRNNIVRKWTLPPVTTTTPGSKGCPTLPTTGKRTGPLLAVGLELVLLGSSIVVLTGGRRRTT